MKKDRRYPNLKYLLEHFHQDWKESYKSDAALLEDFVCQNPRELVHRAVLEIDQLLDEERRPSEVDALLTKQWGAETPYRNPQDAVKWLKRVAEALRAKAPSLRERQSTPIPRPNIEKHPGLYLLMCQFDEDWKHVFGSELKVLKHFKQSSSPEDLAACIDDIQRLLRAESSEEDLRQMLTVEFRAYPPLDPDHKVRPWLKTLLRFFRNVKLGE